MALGNVSLIALIFMSIIYGVFKEVRSVADRVCRQIDSTWLLSQIIPNPTLVRLVRTCLRPFSLCLSLCTIQFMSMGKKFLTLKLNRTLLFSVDRGRRRVAGDLATLITIEKEEWDEERQGARGYHPSVWGERSKLGHVVLGLKFKMRSPRHKRHLQLIFLVNLQERQNIIIQPLKRVSL